MTTATLREPSRDDVLNWLRKMAATHNAHPCAAVAVSMLANPHQVAKAALNSLARELDTMAANARAAEAPDEAVAYERAAHSARNFDPATGDIQIPPAEGEAAVIAHRHVGLLREALTLLEHRPSDRDTNALTSVRERLQQVFAAVEEPDSADPTRRRRQMLLQQALFHLEEKPMTMRVMGPDRLLEMLRQEVRAPSSDGEATKKVRP